MADVIEVVNGYGDHWFVPAHRPCSKTWRQVADEIEATFDNPTVHCVLPGEPDPWRDITGIPFDDWWTARISRDPQRMTDLLVRYPVGGSRG